MFNGGLLGVFLGTIFALSVHFGGSFFSSASATPAENPPPEQQPPAQPIQPPDDDDDDKIPNDWEIQFGHNPNDDSDAESDFDNDGLSLAEEYQLHQSTGGQSGNPLGNWSVSTADLTDLCATLTSSAGLKVVDVNNSGSVLLQSNDGFIEKAWTVDFPGNQDAPVISEILDPENSGANIRASDINDNGTVACTVTPLLSSIPMGCLWTGGSLISLGNSIAKRINNRGSWVGFSEIDGIWQPTAFIDNQLWVSTYDSAWNLSNPLFGGLPIFDIVGINENDQVLGIYADYVTCQDSLSVAWKGWVEAAGFPVAYPDTPSPWGSNEALINRYGEFATARMLIHNRQGCYYFNGDTAEFGGNRVTGLSDSGLVVSEQLASAWDWWAGPQSLFVWSDGVQIDVRRLPLPENFDTVANLSASVSGSGIIAVSNGAIDAKLVILVAANDMDGDGMSDDWEEYHHLNPSEPSDAFADNDADGINNLGEYSLRIDPNQYNTRAPDNSLIDIRPGIDKDGDGIPNAWELEHGLDYEDPTDATQDPDRDGFSSLQEFQFNTDPHGAPVYRIREIGPFPEASSANLSTAKLGSGLDAESCLGPQEGTLMESVFFPASPLDNWHQRPAAWSLRRSEVQGSLTFYQPNSNFTWSPIAVSASGATICTNGGSPATLTYWPSQAAPPVNLPGVNYDVRKFEAVSLSPSGSWAAGWRTRNSTGEMEAVRWQMGASFQPIALPLTATDGTQFNLPTNTPLHVNDHGSVATTARVGTADRAVLWHSKSDTYSVTLLPSLGGAWSSALGLSNSADDPIVAGNSVLLNGQRRATAWTTSGTASDLGTLDNGNDSMVSGIAPSGLVSCISNVAGGATQSLQKTFIAKYVTQPGSSNFWKIVPQGVTASSISHTAITDAAEILGSTTNSGQPEVPTLWRLGRAYPLDTVLPPSSGYHLVSIKALNSNGTLLASVNKDGVESQILLTPDPDTDGDGLPDAFENRHQLSAYTSQPPQTDTDEDGLSDLAEFAAGTNPRSKDSDTDGMYDGWENSWGFDPLDAYDAALDTDGDHVSNLREYQLLTNPVGLYRLETFNQPLSETFHSITPAGSLATVAFDADGSTVRLRHVDEAGHYGASEDLEGFDTMSITEPNGGLVIRDELRDGAWNWSAVWGPAPGFVYLADSLQANPVSRPFTQNSLGDIIMSTSGGLGAPPGFAESYATGMENQIIESQEFASSISLSLSPNGRHGLFTVYDSTVPFDPYSSMFGGRHNQVIDTLGNSRTLPYAPQIQVEQEPVDTDDDGIPDYYPPPVMEYTGTPFNWTALNDNGDALGIQQGGNIITCASGSQALETFEWPTELANNWFCYSFSIRVGYLADRSFVIEPFAAWMPSYRISLVGSVAKATRIRKPGLSPWEGVVSIAANGVALGDGPEPFLVLNGTTVRLPRLRTFLPSDVASRIDVVRFCRFEIG